ncbi:hypothetical protein F4778DRAFT_233991 [Xylariomycetidae sp. FL2044]|nr:hypothetical protein F4778DRAFT_233991 [Xylariomycetidae sp. FL2044]
MSCLCEVWLLSHTVASYLSLILPPLPTPLSSSSYLPGICPATHLSIHSSRRLVAQTPNGCSSHLSICPFCSFRCLTRVDELAFRVLPSPCHTASGQNRPYLPPLCLVRRSNRAHPNTYLLPDGSHCLPVVLPHSSTPNSFNHSLHYLHSLCCLHSLH